MKPTRLTAAISTLEVRSPIQIGLLFKLLFCSVVPNSIQFCTVGTWDGEVGPLSKGQDTDRHLLVMHIESVQAKHCPPLCDNLGYHFL